MRKVLSSLGSPRMQILSEEQKEAIHLAALELLRRTGMRVHCQEAIDLLREAGCPVSDGNLVKIPAHLVSQALRTAPRRIPIYNRKGKPAMFLEGTNVYYGTGSDLPNTIDLFTGERRKSAKQDVANVAKLCDALPNIDFVMSMALPWDVPVPISDLHSFEAMVSNSTKPIVYTAWDKQGLADIIDMASAVAGGKERLQERPFLIFYGEPSTPMQHSKEAVEKLLLIAENGLPVTYIPGLMMGSAAPVTMAGAMALGNAELLFGLVIAQLKRPGSPYLFGVGAAPLDMCTMVSVHDSPEFMLVTSAMAEMGRYYGLPTWGFAGTTDSKLFDEQAGIEGTLWSLMAALSGTNLVHDVGYVESALTCSYEMIAAMDEVIGLVKKLMAGIEVTEETLAIDVIDQVGPGGQFLSTDHTMEHYRGIWYPSLFDRRNYDEWAELGKKTLRERANEKVRRILENHQPEPLPQHAKDAIDQVLKTASRRVVS